MVRMPKLITGEWIQKAGGCQAAKEAVVRGFPNGMPITRTAVLRFVSQVGAYTASGWIRWFLFTTNAEWKELEDQAILAWEKDLQPSIDHANCPYCKMTNMSIQFALDRVVR